MNEWMNEIDLKTDLHKWQVLKLMHFSIHSRFNANSYHTLDCIAISYHGISSSGFQID